MNTSPRVEPARGDTDRSRGGHGLGARGRLPPGYRFLARAHRAYGAGVLPIVWLLGTSGVGKSTVGYRLLAHLDAIGVTAAFVDADQLRLASAVRVTETELIAAALPAMFDNYAAQEAKALVVAGVMDDAEHLTRLLPAVPRPLVLTVLLEADADTIRERVRRRGWLTDLADAAVDYAARIDTDVADLRLNTTGRSPGDLAHQLTGAALEHVRQAERRSVHPRSPQQPTAPAPARVVAITGPGGVGVSSTGFQTFSVLAEAGEPVGYLDVHQLGLLGTDVRGDHLGELRVANARAVARSLTHAGAETVVVSGDPHTIRLLIDNPHHEPGEPDSTSVFWLDASAAALAGRLTERARGRAPVLQGDHRVGLGGDDLEADIAATVHQREHDSRPSAARVIDTTELDARQVAEAVHARLISSGTSPPRGS